MLFGASIGFSVRVILVYPQRKQPAVGKNLPHTIWSGFDDAGDAAHAVFFDAECPTPQGSRNRPHGLGVVVIDEV
jgi:hypothetical protein